MVLVSETRSAGESADDGAAPHRLQFKTSAACDSSSIGLTESSPGVAFEATPSSCGEVRFQGNRSGAGELEDVV